MRVRIVHPTRLLRVVVAGILVPLAGFTGPHSRALAVPTGSPAIVSSPAAEWEAFSDLAFDVTLRDFLEEASLPSALRDPRFDWSTDWCSAPLIGNTGRSFDFTSSCRRHDFGYRNLHRLERRWGWGRRYWNPTNRERVDRRFLADMLDHCATRSIWLRWSCRTWARVYFTAVRRVGGWH